MAYSLFYSRQAEKYLARLTPSKISAILKRIKHVSSDPLRLDNNIVKLTGTISSYRLRLGDVRIIYQLETKTKSMYVVKIAPRSSAYS